MADPIYPLIQKIVKSPTPSSNYNTDNEKVPTVYAVNQLFSGLAVANTSNMNDLKACGVYRFSTKLNNMPEAVTSGGTIVVYNERLSEDEVENHAAVLGGTTTTDFGYTEKSYVRQIIWPDGPDNITPYTRTFVNNIWTEWQTLGGNLRRVQLTANLTTETNPAQINVMYYSFGNHTLYLPNPNKYPLSTRIGLEQYLGKGTVKWVNEGTTYTQNTEPAYQADSTGEPTTTVIGPNVYYFEIVEATANGTRTWILDVDNDLSNTVTDIRAKISSEAIARKNADDALEDKVNSTLGVHIASPYSGTTINARINNEETARKSKDTELENRIAVEENTRATEVGNKNRRTITYYVNTDIATTSKFLDGNNTDQSVTDLLKFVNPIFVLGSGVAAVALPAASAAYNGAKVTIEITSETSVTVTAGNDSEDFTNDTGCTLVLPFECVMTGTNTYAWNLLVIA